MIFKKNKVLFLVGGLLLALVFVNISFVKVTHSQSAAIEADKKAQLEKELLQLEKEIAEKEQILGGQKKKSASLQNEINILKTKISQTKLSIKAQNIIITKLGTEITSKQKTIETLSDKMDRERESLGQLVRKTNELDEASIMNVLLGAQTLSGFYNDLNSFISIKESINKSVDTIKVVKKDTEEEKTGLKKKQDQEIDARVKLEDQQKKVEKDQKEQNILLGISKNKEKEYQKILEERKQRAAEIRSALFSLRDTKAIPFGRALDYAIAASKKTGVRPAIILAILTQESNLGQNVGTCNRAGDPASKKWNVIMPGPVQIATGKSKRDDQSAFLKITKELGLDYEITPLSCPLSSGGWGGAMGPSQFIPTTWELFKSKISKALGISTPNPWDAGHSIMATAIYMGELGADGGTYTTERNAACRYYSGKDCGSSKVKNSFYGDSVIKIAKNIQENMIDPLQGI